MPKQLEFMDCPFCDKRVATTAKICRHCGKFPAALHSEYEIAVHSKQPDESHMAVEHGGYDASHDNFDYKRFVADEFGGSENTTQHKKTWWRFTAWLLISAMLLPLLLQVLSLFNIR